MIAACAHLHPAHDHVLEVDLGRDAAARFDGLVPGETILATDDGSARHDAGKLALAYAATLATT